MSRRYVSTTGLLRCLVGKVEYNHCHAIGWQAV